MIGLSLEIENALSIANKFKITVNIIILIKILLLFHFFISAFIKNISHLLTINIIND